MKWEDILDSWCQWETFIGHGVCSGLNSLINSIRRRDDYYWASYYLRRNPELVNDVLTRLYNLYIFTDYDKKYSHPYSDCILAFCLLLMDNAACGFQLTACITCAKEPISHWISRLPGTLLEEAMKGSLIHESV